MRIIDDGLFSQQGAISIYGPTAKLPPCAMDYNLRRIDIGKRGNYAGHTFELNLTQDSAISVMFQEGTILLPINLVENDWLLGVDLHVYFEDFSLLIPTVIAIETFGDIVVNRHWQHNGIQLDEGEQTRVWDFDFAYRVCTVTQKGNMSSTYVDKIYAILDKNWAAADLLFALNKLKN